MLTITLITKNNEQTIKKCLESISTLKSEIIILDLGSNDKTLDFCKNYTVKTITSNNLSKTRNQYLKNTTWNLLIFPWETLTNGHEEINIISEQLTEKLCFDVKVISNKIINREIRLWNNELNIQFENNIFETLNFNNSIHNSDVIIKPISKINFDVQKIIDNWKTESPLCEKPYYYEAYYYLENKKYDQFINSSYNFLFRNKYNNISSIMLRYNLAMVETYVKKNIKSSLNNILICIAEQPVLPEFWCLLGDIYYYVKDYRKAASFYENAIILGGKREIDFFPLDIKKCKEYPQRMMDNCINILKSENYLFAPINK